MPNPLVRLSPCEGIYGEREDKQPDTTGRRTGRPGKNNDFF
jgi:hypothetical protein